jgi:hypothetical protein
MQRFRQTVADLGLGVPYFRVAASGCVLGTLDVLVHVAASASLVRAPALP